MIVNAIKGKSGPRPSTSTSTASRFLFTPLKAVDDTTSKETQTNHLLPLVIALNDSEV